MTKIPSRPKKETQNEAAKTGGRQIHLDAPPSVGLLCARFVERGPDSGRREQVGGGENEEAAGADIIGHYRESKWIQIIEDADAEVSEIENSDPCQDRQRRRGARGLSVLSHFLYEGRRGDSCKIKPERINREQRADRHSRGLVINPECLGNCAE